MQIHAFTKMGSKESAQIKEVQRRKMTPKNKKSKKDCFCWDLNLSLGCPIRNTVLHSVVQAYFQSSGLP